MSFLGPLGSILEVLGAGANLLGQPYIGIPMQVAGGAAKGGEEGGVGGALKSAGKSGIGSAISLGTNAGLGSFIDSLKTPTDVGSISALSSTGKALTVPGVRPNPIEGLWSASSGGRLTIPASPREFLGGS